MDELVPGQHAFETGGTIVAYYVRGRGPPCLVSPYPWGMNSEPMRIFFRPLERHVTLIYHDPPGTGRSGPPTKGSDLGIERVVSDISALQRRLGVRQAVVLGHSGGSVCALLYALRFPERVSDLILVSTGAVFPDLLKSAELREILDPSTAERDEDRFRRFVARLLGPEIHTREGKLAMGRAMKSSMGFNIDRAAYNLLEMKVWDATEELGGLQVRTLIAAGRLDKLTTLKRARAMCKAIPGCRLATFEKSGHFPFLDEPGKFHDTVVGFLGKRRLG